jgi:penicillin V acylase-like amidase (Ntn superfamily)
VGHVSANGFTADDGRVVAGRSMDWAEDMDADL